MTNVREWLESLDLGQHAHAFEANEVDWDVLGNLDHDLLKELGVIAVGQRLRILKAIETLSAASRDVFSPSKGPAPTEALRSNGEAERRQLTVMFADIVGSTELSQQLDPEDLREITRAYQDAAKVAIEGYGGFVARYMGDGVLAYFGYPRAHEDDAERAVRSGLGLVDAVQRLAVPVKLSVRVGIATGPVVVGDIIGEGASQESAVVGETPNLAARMQSIARPDGVVISDSTQRLVEGRFELRSLGAQQLRGLSGSVPVYEALDVRTAQSRFDASHVEELITPLIGRQSELSLLEQRWERACEHEGQVVLLQGEPGIGKSRLLQALRDRVRGAVATVQRYQCSPYHSGTAFYPVIDFLERAAGFAPQDNEDTRLDKLEALLASTRGGKESRDALLATLLSLPPERYAPLNMPPQKRRAETIEALAAALAEATEQRPLMVIFEDLHWTDPSTLEFLDAAIDRIQSLPVLMLLSFRPEFTAPWTAHGHVTMYSLNRLGRREVGDLAQGVTGGRVLPPDVLDQIVAKTDGVPLFVEELTKTVLEAGILAENDGGYAHSGPLPDLAIPSTLQDSLLSRLDRLAEAKEIAQIGACIGREFSYELIAAVSDNGERELGQSLERLLEHSLVFSRGRPPEATYVFKHALVQDAARASLLRSRRQPIHARIARTLEAQSPEIRSARPELLAHHYTEAGDRERAITYWQRAGERATQSFANIEAIGHLQQGLRLVEHLPEGRDRSRHELEIQSLLAPLFSIINGWNAAEPEQAYSRARDLAEQLGDNEKLFVSLRGLFYLSYTRLDFSKALDLGRKLGALAEELQVPVFHVYAQHSLAITLFMQGDPVVARDHLEQGIALYDRDAHADSAYQYGHDAGVVCLAYSALAWWITGYPETARQRADEAIELARALAHPYTLAIGSALVAMVHQHRGDAQATREHASTAVAIATEANLSLPLLIGSMMTGWASASEGRVQEGVDRMQQSIDSWRTIAEPRTWALGSGGTGAFTPDSERPLRPCNHRAN